MEKDVAAGIRTEDVIQRSIERIPLYAKLSTHKIDVSDITPEQVANSITRIVEKKKAKKQAVKEHGKNARYRLLKSISNILGG